MVKMALILACSGQMLVVGGQSSFLGHLQSAALLECTAWQVAKEVLVFILAVKSKNKDKLFRWVVTVLKILQRNLSMPKSVENIVLNPAYLSSVLPCICLYFI